MPRRARRGASAVTAPDAQPRVPCGLLRARRLAGSGAGRGDASPPLAAGGGRARSRRPLAAGPRAATRSRRRPGRARPCWRPAPGARFGRPVFDCSLVHSAQGASHQFKPLLFWKQWRPRGAGVCSSFSQMEGCERVPQRESRRTVLCVTSAVRRLLPPPLPESQCVCSSGTEHHSLKLNNLLLPQLHPTSLQRKLRNKKSLQIFRTFSKARGAMLNVWLLHLRDPVQL